MSRSAVTRCWAAWLVLSALGLVFCTAAWGLLGHFDGDVSALRSRRLWRLIRFSFMQASLSTILSLGLGLLMALALHRRRFWGRGLLISLLSASFVLPPIVVVAGIIAVFGRSGWLSDALILIGSSGLGQWIFGLWGILIAHVFFNAAFSGRVFLGLLQSVPSAQWRTAHQLGFKPWTCWRTIDWPAVRGAVPNLAVLVFLLTFTSFAIVLTLGGGPRASTLEVAIFEAIKFDFDINKAVLLALIQMLIGASLLLIANATRFPWPSSITKDAGVARPDNRNASAIFMDALTTALVTLVIVLPSIALIAKGFAQFVGGHGLNTALLKAVLTSLGIATVSACLALLLAVAMGLAKREVFATWRTRDLKRRHRLLDYALSNAANLILVLPVFVLSTGLFIVLRQVASPADLALPLIVIVNALMALPFMVALVAPAFISAANATDRICMGLNLQGWTRFWRIDLPLVKPALARAMAYGMALSLGDLGVVALFGSQNLQTLPFLLYQRMGAYRFGEAMATALVLVVLVVGIFMLVERLGGNKGERHSHA